MKQTGARNLDTVAEDGGDLRPIHYIGNNSRYFSAIESALDSVARPGARACDLFAGTGVVTRRLAQSRTVEVKPL